MYRRLMAWSMAIAGVAALAFLIPLGLNVRQYQHDIAMVRAQQEAREISSYATFTGDVSRLTNTLRNLDYAATSSNDIVVWYQDGRAVSATERSASVGTMPASVSSAISNGFGAERPSEQSVDGGRELLWPAPVADGNRVVVRVFVPNSVLNDAVLTKWAWLAAVGTAIVLAAGVVAGRFGRYITPPSAKSAERQPVV